MAATIPNFAIPYLLGYIILNFMEFLPNACELNRVMSTKIIKGSPDRSLQVSTLLHKETPKCIQIHVWQKPEYNRRSLN